MSAPWITYRPELKVLDCTIRDGGLVNDHMFDDGLVKAVYETCVEAGVDYMELGYKADGKIFAKGNFGDWKFCREDDMRRIVGDNDSDLKLAVKISLTIDKEGRPTVTDVAGGPVPDAMKTCLSKVIRDWPYEWPTGDAEPTVTYSVQFEPA